MWIWLILLWMITPSSYAANPYKLGQVDYFHQFEPLEKGKEEFDWRDASLSEDGQMNYYTPPAPVLSLLTNPTSQNARTYLHWQKQKIEKIMRAQKAIEQALKEGNPS